MLTQILTEIKERMREVTSCSGCNDWTCEYTDENWEFLNMVARYGAASGWWDDECGPHISDDKKTIYWQDSFVYCYAMNFAIDQAKDS